MNCGLKQRELIPMDLAKAFDKVVVLFESGGEGLEHKHPPLFDVETKTFGCFRLKLHYIVISFGKSFVYYLQFSTDFLLFIFYDSMIKISIYLQIIKRLLIEAIWFLNLLTNQK